MKVFDGLEKPEGLDPAGDRAWKTVVEFINSKLTEADMPYFEKNTFYSPKQWTDRGEEYGTSSRRALAGTQPFTHYRRYCGDFFS
jgi:hypothetical protein